MSRFRAFFEAKTPFSLSVTFSYILFDSRKSSSFLLSFRHSFPAEKSVHIVYKEYGKAYYNGKIRYVCDSRYRPENYQHNVIERIDQSIVRTPSEGKVYGDKACGD